MGVVYSRIVRQVNRLNVENRALRAIERKKPVVAPKHPSTKNYIDDILKDSDVTAHSLQQKDLKLDAYLKDVYVSSTGFTPEIARDKSKLPKNVRPVQENEFGFWEPDEVPEGKASLGSIMKFLACHQGDRLKWTSTAIAKEYKLNKDEVDDVLEYYKTFNLYIPEGSKKKSAGSIFFEMENFLPTNFLGSGKPTTSTSEATDSLNKPTEGTEKQK